MFGKHPALAVVYLVIISIFLSASAPFLRAQDQSASGNTWSFAVSGDSRNCGNVVMPAIAAGVKRDHAAFYWHMGDLRAIYGIDEDYKAEPEHRGKPPDMQAYLQDAWSDFIAHQAATFEPVPFLVGIGNHELIAPKTRQEFVTKFQSFLDSPTLHKQRMADDPQDVSAHSYYHWIQGGIDFIYLDNASQDQFDAAQLKWFEGVLARARRNDKVHGVVVGMHEALPWSLALGHSMNDWPLGVKSGEQVYQDLLDFRSKTKKPVYLLASHSHFYMSDNYKTDYWMSHGGVIPGWIVGNAGAFRYPLPPEATKAREKREKVYGYLLATVHIADGVVDFNFKEVSKDDLSSAVGDRYTPDFIDYCVNQNFEVKRPAAPR